MLQSTYIKTDESVDQRFINVALAYSSDLAQAKRIEGYMQKKWLIPSTPVLANTDSSMVDQMYKDGEFHFRKYEMIKGKRTLPISCFLQYVPDTLKGIIDASSESKYLSTSGGGYSKYYGDVRGSSAKSPGTVPLMMVDDKEVLAYYQGTTRRGAEAVYLKINHPDIRMFISGRDPTGGDVNQKFLNLHNGVVLNNAFLASVEAGETVNLIDPATGAITGKEDAKALWLDILAIRHKTGEPYLMNEDTCNEAIPQTQKDLGLSIKSSNLCTEITLAIDETRTAVCCIANVNLETHDEWENDNTFIADVVEFLDNVIECFTVIAPDVMHKAKFSAMRERALALSVMGFHALLQKKNIAFEGALAVGLNRRIFRDIHTKAVAASVALGEKFGEAPDMVGTGRRNSHLISLAPTASTSQIMGTSPSVEPLRSNIYTQRTQLGNYVVKNRYLEALLESKGKNTAEVWESVSGNKGSVQHLTFLSGYEKAVFKTAFEIDQNWVVQHAIDRQPFVCQSQSINLFFPSLVDIRYLHAVHWKAMKSGLKTLYYLRSEAAQTGESRATVRKVEMETGKDFITDPNVCLACQ
jgi:ribonucleoside-diphosphate reductase alpha chain